MLHKHTNCLGCLFVDLDNNTDQCYFNIPNLLQHTHTIEKQPGGDNKILDYLCGYAFSKEVFSQHSDTLNITTMVQDILQRNEIPYYLVTEIPQETIDITGLCDTINALPIKPKGITFINRTDPNIKDRYIAIKQTISKDIPWEFQHPQIQNITIEQTLLVVAESPRAQAVASAMLYYDSSITNNPEILRLRVDFLQAKIMLEKSKVFLILDTPNHQDGLLISLSGYQDMLKGLEYKYADQDLLSKILGHEKMKIAYYDHNK